MPHDRVTPARARWLAAALLMPVFFVAQPVAAAELDPLSARIGELRAALPSGVKQVDENDLKGIAQLVERLFGAQGICVGEAGKLGYLAGLFKSRDRAQELATCFDVERMFRVFESEAYDRPGVTRALFRQQVQREFFDKCAQARIFMRVAHCGICRLHLRSDHGEAELYLRQRLADGPILLTHFWLCKREGAWRIREFELSDTGRRLLALWIARESITGDARIQFDEATNAIDEADLLTSDGSYDRVEAVLAPVDKIQVDTDMEVLRWIVKGRVHLEKHDFDQAGACLAKAEALRPDSAVLKNERTKWFLRQRKFAEAYAAAQRHQDQAGPDADIFDDMGRALFELGNVPGAIAAHRRGMQENPQAFYNLTSLLSIKPNLVCRELDEYFSHVRLEVDEFENLADELSLEQAYAALESLIARFRQLDPSSHRCDAVEAEMFAARRQLTRAAALFQAGMLKHGKKGNFQERYLDCMLELHRGIEGYRAARDADAAFNYLANEADDAANYHRGLLAELIAAHRERSPRDPMLIYYEARGKQRDREHLAAAELLLKGMKEVAGTDRWRWQNRYVESMLLADRPLEAYEAANWQGELFEELADNFVRRGQPDRLDKLLALRQKSHPQDQRLTAYRARLLLLQDKPQEAVDLLRPLLHGETKHYEQEIFLDAMLACERPVEAYFESPLRERSFSYLASSLDGDKLEKLLAAARTREPNHPELDVYQARLLLERDQQAAAVAFLRGAMLNAAVKERDEMQAIYLPVAEELHGALIAYEGAPDCKSAFRSLASDCHFDDDYDTLEKLLAAHRQRAPDDQAVAAQYAAHIHAHFGRRDAAIEKYTEAIALDHADEISWSCRWKRDELLVDAGKVVEAYQRGRPSQIAFTQLADACIDQDDVDQFAALLAVRRRDVADPDELVRWEAEFLQLRKDDEGIVKLLLNRPASAPRWDEIDDYLFRSLIRLKRFDDAARIADRLDHNVPFYTAIVAGSRGDVAVTTKALEECIKHGGYNLDSFAADDILGPLLNTPPFEEFWKKQKALDDADRGTE